MLRTAINMVNTFIKWWKQEKMWWEQLFDYGCDNNVIFIFLLYSYITLSEDFYGKAEHGRLKTTFYEKRGILKFFVMVEGFLVYILILIKNYVFLSYLIKY